MIFIVYLFSLEMNWLSSLYKESEGTLSDTSMSMQLNIKDVSAILDIPSTGYFMRQKPG